MAQREGRLLYRPGEQYTLQGLSLHEGDALDILVSITWVSGHVHYEASDGSWYCDAGPMSIPLYDGREARFRLEMVHHKQNDEKDLSLDDPDELDEEDEWETEEFEHEEW